MSYTRYHLTRQVIRAPQGFDVDHIDGDVLNDDETNLRIVTRTANNLNSKAHVNVRLDGRGRFYYVKLKYNGKTYQKGGFPTIEEAKEHIINIRLSFLLEELKKTRHLNSHLTDEQYYK